MDEQIKLPVRYDAKSHHIFEADGRSLCWLSRNTHHPRWEEKDKDGEYLASIINATRREAALVEALEHYGNEDNWICGNENCCVEYGPCGHVMDVYAGQSGNGNVIAQTALKAYKGDKSDE